MNCPTCGYPMTWSLTRERVTCSVYGDHPARRPSRLMLRADHEYLDQYTATGHPRTLRAAS